ncbi:hypothetical protein RSW84_30145, partial [Escherichia coli]|uniref:hypothetical protein n=1 Tax=Escherichia coli TaxID=562 RepID=UPI0028DD9F8D
DGKDTLMLRRGNQFLVYNTLGSSTADRVFYYGLPSDVVLVGDWNGDGKDTLAMRRGVAYYMRNSLGSGNADTVIYYGL